MSLPCTRDTRYATVIMDADPRPVVGHGNSGRYPPFFERLGERCQRVEAVAMDIFDLGETTLPQAEVV